MPFKSLVDKAKYSREYLKKRVAQGLCASCGKPVKSKWLCEIHLKQVNERSLRYTKRIKQICIDHYGGKCICCNEINIYFLTIDHTNNDGNTQRKEIGGRKDWGGRNLYVWLKRNNYPINFQVMCFNCNLGRSINKGVCPHLTL